MRSLKIGSCFALVAFLVQAGTSSAQETVGVKPGDRVMVTAPECQLRKQTATLLSLEKDLFSATVGDTDIQCPVEAVTQLEVWKGEEHWWKWVFIGTGVGAGVGAVFGLAWGSQCEFDFLDTCGPGPTLFAMASTLTGLLSGLAIGLTSREKSWKEVRLPLVQPSLFVSRGNRLNVGFSIPVRR
jgi:hypothetical protein